VFPLRFVVVNGGCGPEVGENCLMWVVVFSGVGGEGGDVR